MNVSGIGIDVIRVSRFSRFSKNKKHHFLLSVFTTQELEYCFAFKDSAPHLAGTFAAKEAAVKALSGSKTVLPSAIEVRHKKSGKPELWVNARLQKRLLVTLSHDAILAIAVVVAT